MNWQDFMKQFPQLVETVGKEKFWRVRFRILPDQTVLITPNKGVTIHRDIVSLAERKAAEIVQQSDSKNSA